MTDNRLTQSGPKLTDSDLDAVESAIGQPLPTELRELYRRYNGGRPERRCFYDEKGGEHAIHGFLIMRHRRSAVTPLFEETLERLKSKSLIPSALLPIATNEGGDYYVLNIDDGKISFLSMDYATEPARALRHVANSLKEFLDEMITDDEMFG